MTDTTGATVAGLAPEQARRIVTSAFGRDVPPATDWFVDAEPVVVTNMTTAGMARVSGTFADGVQPLRWSVFVKTVQPASQSAVWELIPEPFRAQTLEELPWRAEVDLYASCLDRHLPPGLRLPQVHGIVELPDERAAIWMEDVHASGTPWDLEAYRRAATALGRIAGRLPDGRIPADLPVQRRNLRGYFSGRVSQAVLPALRDDATWHHPLVQAVVDDALRTDLDRLAAAVPTLLERLDELPRTLAHGDACPQNLLTAVDQGDLVAIDWGLAGIPSVGYDLAQLLAGRAESGDLDPGALAGIHDVILPAYCAGLEAEGLRVAQEDVLLGYVGALAIRSGFTALPLELLTGPDSPALRTLFRRRAGFARFVVDLAATVT